MALTLDPATEQRIQRQLARGPYTNPSELLARALDLVEAENPIGDWLLQHREDIRKRLNESIAARERGESYSADEAKAILAQRKAARAPQAA